MTDPMDLAIAQIAVDHAMQQETIMAKNLGAYVAMGVAQAFGGKKKK